MFRDLFTTYYDTDPPPIITNDHKIIRDTYNPYIAPTILPSTRQEENISFSEGAYEYAPLKVQTQPIEAPIILDEPQQLSSEKAVDIARQFIGTKYSWGGTTPNTGFDCSGLVKYAYSQAGIELPRTAKELSKVGTKVDSLDDVQVGDLICSQGSGPSGNHVQMVSRIQNGQIYTIEAKGKRYGVIESPLTDTKKITSIRRIPNQNQNNIIIDYFTSKGLTRTQAKGIYGNLMQESGGNIKAVSSDGNNSYGLAQWTGSRKQRLFNMYGPNPTINQQLDFLWWELNNTHKDALKDLKQTSTILDATRVFMNKFERPHKYYANFNRRLRFANSIT